MVNTRKSSLRLLGSKSPGPGPGAGAAPGAAGGSSHFISSRTRSSKTRAASCPAAKAGGSGAGVAADEAWVSDRPASGLCLPGRAGSLRRSPPGARAPRVRAGGPGRAGPRRRFGPCLLCREAPRSPRGGCGGPSGGLAGRLRSVPRSRLRGEPARGERGAGPASRAAGRAGK